jgi:phenylacetate-CoA ligase
MIVSGVNVFPSQIESVLMEFPQIEPQYIIRLFKKGFIDAIRVETEAKPAVYEKGEAYIEVLGRQVADRIQQIVGIKVPVAVLPAGAIPRSIGKAKRVIDEREAIHS